MLLGSIRIAKNFSLSGYGLSKGASSTPQLGQLQVWALSASQGTAARSVEISRLACCSIERRSRTRRVLVVRREWLEEFSAATTRRWGSNTGTASAMTPYAS